MVLAFGSGIAAWASQPDLWTAFESRCLDAYLNQASPNVKGLFEVEPARASQRAFRSSDESLLMILEVAPEEGLHSCLLYGFHTSEDPAGMSGFKKWRSAVLRTGEFETDNIGRLFSTDGAAVSLLVDARIGENVTVYEVIQRD